MTTATAVAVGLPSVGRIVERWDGWELRVGGVRAVLDWTVGMDGAVVALLAMCVAEQVRPSALELAADGGRVRRLSAVELHDALVRVELGGGQAEGRCRHCGWDVGWQPDGWAHLSGRGPYRRCDPQDLPCGAEVRVAQPLPLFDAAVTGGVRRWFGLV